MKTHKFAALVIAHSFSQVAKNEEPGSPPLSLYLRMSEITKAFGKPGKKLGGKFKNKLAKALDKLHPKLTVGSTNIQASDEILHLYVAENDTSATTALDIAIPTHDIQEYLYGKEFSKKDVRNFIANLDVTKARPKKGKGKGGNEVAELKVA